MGYYSVLLCLIESHMSYAVSWSIIVSHGVLRCLKVPYGIYLMSHGANLRVSCSVSWCLMVHYDVSSSVVLSYDVSLS